MKRGGALLPQRFDVPMLAIGTLAVTALHFLFGLWGSDGRLASPLDDTFIHLQYARQIAEGHLFEYNTGDAASSGASSFIYPFMLAPAFVAGLDGMRAVFFAHALNLAAHLVAVLLMYKIGFRLGGRPLALVAAIFLLLDGRLNWVYLSGMETGLYTAGLVGFFWALLCRDGRARLGWLAGIGAFVALLRPEGHVFVSLACVLVGVYLWRKAGKFSPVLLLLFAPIVAGVAPYVANIVMTGHWQFNTAASKSLWYVPYAPLNETISLTVGWAINALKNTYFGLEVGRSPFPLLAAPLAVWGAGVALLGRRTRSEQGRLDDRRWTRFVHALFIVTFLAGIGLALMLPPIQFNRYYMPYDFIFYLYLAIGTLYLARLAGRRSSRALMPPRAATTPAAAHVSSPITRRHRPLSTQHSALSTLVVVVLMLPQFVSYFFAMSDSTRDIYYQQMTFSEWVRRYTPPDARLGVNDTGAHKYLSDRYVIDLIGLTNNHMRGAYFGGWGSVYDRLAALPDDRRPTHLLIHPNVFLNGVNESVSQSLLTPLYAIRVQNPIITAGDTEVLYAVNWEYAILDPGETRVLREGEEPLDRFNVGDVEDEAAHDYDMAGRQASLSEPKSIVTTAPYDESGVSLSDSGRRHSGWEEFTVRSVAGRPLTLVVRDRVAPGAERRLLVLANGREVGLWEARNERDSAWQEYEFTIPADFITADRTTVRIDATFDPGGPGFASYYYWVYRGE